MEMLVMAAIVLGAFAAVLLPLFRRRPGIGDEREFENTASAGTLPRAAPAAPAAPSTAEEPQAPAASPATGDPLEDTVLKYREAVRAGTVCRKCGQANPAGSVYCYECGARLPRADAKEFE